MPASGQTIHFLFEVFAFLSVFQPPKTFFMFSSPTIYPKYILRKQFSQKSFSEKKSQKKFFIFFFFRFFFFWIGSFRICFLKKKVPRLDDDDNVPPILYLVKLFTFFSKCLPFSPFFNLQKLFFMFFSSTIYPKEILRKKFSQKSFSEKKTNQNKIIHFFFRFVFFSIFFFSNFFCPKPKPFEHFFPSMLF